MKRHVLSIASICAAICASAAFDADTIAFYSFAEKTAGASALGGTIQNVVDSSKYEGTVYQAAGGTCNAEIQAGGGQANWSSDRPGKYVFTRRGYNTEIIATDPLSLEVEKLSNSRGAICAFDSLASDLGDLSEWTVEWFWKIPTRHGGYPTQGWFSLPLWTTDRTGTPENFLRVSTSPSGNGRYFRIFAATESSANGGGAGLALLGSTAEADLHDGLWHHVAVSYKNNQATVRADYERAYATVPMTISPTNAAVSLLLPFSGTFYGQIACIRVTKKALSVSDYMAASDNPKCYPLTAFHWSFDGPIGGEAEGPVTNRAYVAADNAGFSMDNLYGQFSSSPGVYGVDTNGNKAVFTNLYPNGEHRRVVRGGGRRLGVDGSSLYLKTTPLNLSTPQTSSTVLWTSGTGIVATNCCQPVTGSFTMEMFAKINYYSWFTNTQYVTRRRTTLFGANEVNQNNRYYNWSLELTPNTNNGSQDTFKINVYTNANAHAGTASGALLARFSYLRGWHHIAVTHDASERRLRLYVDYSLIGSTAVLQRPLVVGALDKQAYYIGCGLNNHSFDGWVDEVRLVRECLTPEQFLRLEPEPGTKVLVK